MSADRRIVSHEPHSVSAPKITAISPRVDDQSAASGRIELFDEIARGGMGSIIKARDSLLNRDLALKVLINESDDDGTTHRFFKEAQINGQLQHPGIVPVYEVGRLTDSRPFFAMKLVNGKTLRELLDERSDPSQDRQRFLGIFEQVCQTMAYAHSCKVVHRDLKPSNIMVGAFGEVQVMDWGVAKLLSQDEETESQGDIDTIAESGPLAQTRDDVVLGTLAYMPPEQALGDKERVAETADVFGLGAILCEIIAGSPPYQGKSTKVLHQLASRYQMDEAIKRLDDCSADAELVALAKHCLQLEPEGRPANAGVLADQMREYFESVDRRYRQVELDRTTQKERAKRLKVWKALAATLAASFALIALSGLWLLTQRFEIEQSKRLAAEKEVEKQSALAALEERARKVSQKAQAREHQLREESEKAKRKSETALCDVYTDRGLTAASKGETGEAMMWFAAAADLAGPDEKRRHNSLLRANNWMRSSAIPVGAHSIPGRPHTVEFQPGGTRILVCYTPLAYEFRPAIPPSTIFKEQSNPELKWLEAIEMPEVPTTKHALKFSIYDWEHDRVVPWLDSADNVGAACWNPSGDHVAIGLRDGNVQIRNVNDGRIVQTIGDNGDIRCLAYSDDGKQLAIASDEVRIWKTETKEFVHETAWKHPTEVHSMSFSPDGELLVTAAQDSVARIYSTDSADDRETPIFRIPHLHLYSRQLTNCKHAPPWLNSGDGGHRLAGICGYGEIAVWDVESGSAVQRFDLKHYALGKLQAVGDMLAVTGDISAHILSQSEITNRRFSVTHTNYVPAMKVDAKNEMLFTSSLDTTARFWSLKNGAPAGTIINHDCGVGAIDIAGDGQWIATVTMNGAVRVWSRPVQPDCQELDACAFLRAPTFSPDGRFVVPRKSEGVQSTAALLVDEIDVFDTHTGKKAGAAVRSKGQTCDACFSGDSSLLVVAHHDSLGYVSSYDLKNDSERKVTVELSALPIWIEAHPKLPIVAVLCNDSKLNVVELTEGEILYQSQFDSRQDWFCKIRFTPDGKKVVVCNQDYFQALDAVTGTPCFERVFYTNANHENCQIAISPDSNTIAISSSDSARFWDLNDGTEVGKPLIHTKTSHYLGAVVSMQFSPDSNRLLTACFDHYARHWDWRTGEQVCAPMKHTDEVHCAVFTADGQYAVTGSKGQDCGPHVWELSTGLKVAPSWQSHDGSQVNAVHAVAISPDGKRLFATTNTPGGNRLVKFDFEKLITGRTIDSSQYQQIGELASSKRIHMGRTDKLPAAIWLKKWSDFTTKYPQLCRNAVERLK